MGILYSLVQLYSFVIIARAISTFFPIAPGSPLAPIVDILYRLTEPVFAPIRRVMPATGPFDFTPLVVLLLINIVIMPILASLV